MGFAPAGIGMNVMQDANHVAYISNTKVNIFRSYLELIGRLASELENVTQHASPYLYQCCDALHGHSG
jgi:hypothetical protein